MRKLMCGAALLLSAAVPAVADTYFGLAYVNAGNSGLCDRVEALYPDAATTFTESECGNDADTQQLLIGYQPWSWLAFELKYFNNLDYRAELTGEDQQVELKSELRGTSLSAVGFWDFSKSFAAYASAGVMDWKAEYVFHSRAVVDDEPVTEDIDDEARDRSHVMALGLMWRGEEGVSLRLSAERVNGLDDELGFAEELTLYTVGFQAAY